MGLKVVPLKLKEVMAFVDKHHRHNDPLPGWKFGCGVVLGDVLVGVVAAGRPISRVIQKAEPMTVEVTRTCTDGTRNANSMLYGAIWRAAKALGYTRAFTYIQADEDGASLRAVGWVKVKDMAARGSWAEHSVAREGRSESTGGVARQMWEIKR